MLLFWIIQLLSVFRDYGVLQFECYTDIVQDLRNSCSLCLIFMSQKHRSITHSSLINLTALVVPLLLALITIPIYLRLIGEVRYGFLTIAWLLLGYFGLFDFGLGKAAAQRLAQLHDASHVQRQEVFWTAAIMSVSLGAIGAVALFFSADWLFTDVLELNQPLLSEAQAAVPWLAIALPLTTGISMLAGSLQARQAFFTLAVGQVTGQAMSLILPLVAAAFGFVEIHYLIPATIIGQMIGGLGLVIGCAYHLPLSSCLRWSTSHARGLLKYGGWIAVSGIVGPLMTVIDRFVLGARLDMTAVTTYTVPYQIVTRISLLPNSLVAALFPKLSMQEADAARTLMNHALKAITVTVTPLVVLTLLLLEPFLSAWVGPDLSARATPVGEVLLLGVWINAIAYIPLTFLQARGRPDIPAKFHLLEIGPYIAILWLLTDSYGTIGAAIAWSLRVTVDTLLLFIAVKRDWQYMSYFTQAATLVILAAMLLYFDSSWEMQVYGGIFLVVLALLWSIRHAPAELWTLLSRLPLLGHLRFLRNHE